MTILVIGASSQIGYFLLPQLDAADQRWLGLTRTPPEADPRWLRGRVPDAMPPLPPLTAILSTGPLDLVAQWLSTAQVEGMPHVIATSSMSAETKRDSEVPYERDLSTRLREAEASLIRTCESRRMPWTLFRPTLVYGAGMDKSITPIVQAAMRRRVFPLPAGRGLRQPVHAADIADAFIAALANPQARGKTFPMGGGDRLTAAEMFRRGRRSAGVATVPAPVPRIVLKLLCAFRPGLRGALQRLDSDLVANNSELETVLGIHPRPFRPDPDTWKPRSMPTAAT
jgi:nucleoside-diphosphate-sugar epimerase